jgi:hypothetical protein
MSNLKPLCASPTAEKEGRDSHIDAAKYFTLFLPFLIGWWRLLLLLLLLCSRFDSDLLLCLREGFGVDAASVLLPSLCRGEPCRVSQTSFVQNDKREGE